jgi:hypothetical protein
MAWGKQRGSKKADDRLPCGWPTPKLGGPSNTVESLWIPHEIWAWKPQEDSEWRGRGQADHVKRTLLIYSNLKHKTRPEGGQTPGGL